MEELQLALRAEILCPAHILKLEYLLDYFERDWPVYLRSSPRMCPNDAARERRRAPLRYHLRSFTLYIVQLLSHRLPPDISLELTLTCIRPGRT